jgi:hypothetical protein
MYEFTTETDIDAVSLTQMCLALSTYVPVTHSLLIPHGR